MTLQELIGEALKGTPDADPHDIAASIFGEVETDDLLRLIAREVEWTQRGLARAVEHEAMTDFRNRFSGPLPPQLQDDPGLSALFRSKFSLGDGRDIAWGEATVEQHEQRIAFLEKQRDGISRTIAQHQSAIKTIRQAGVSCLNDLFTKAA